MSNKEENKLLSESFSVAIISELINAITSSHKESKRNKDSNISNRGSDLIDVGNKVGSVKRAFKANNNIRRMARNAIFQYPVLTSDAITLATTKTINYSLENEYLTLLKLAMSMNDIVVFDQSNAAVAKKEFLDQFYTNFDSKDWSNDEEEEKKDKFGSASLQESILASCVEVDDPAAFVKYIQENYETINSDNMVTLEEDLNMKSINSCTVKVQSLQEDKDDTKENQELLKRNGKFDQGSATKTNFSQENKKANDRAPSLLTVTLTLSNKNGSQYESTMIIGVQCTTHYVVSEEMCYYLAKALTTNKFSFRAIQWTTGEIGFWDFLLNIDTARKENKSNKFKSKETWDRLTDINNINRAKRFQSKNANTFLPNTTIVITEEETNILRNKFGVDIKNIKNLKKIFSVYALLGLVIVDEIDEIAYMFDNEKQKLVPYQFSSLKKKESNDSLSTIVNALTGKVGR